MTTIRATLAGVHVAPKRSGYRCARCGITRPYRPGRGDLCRDCRLARGCRCWSCDWERRGRR